jgi:hypothetical protein
MSLASLNIFPNEHYISWFVRNSQFRAYPEFKHYLVSNQVDSETLKAYEVIHPSVRSFLQHFEQKGGLLRDHTLLPLWQISVAKMLGHKELLENGFLDFHYSNGEKTLFQFDRSWHSCPTCRHEDIDSFGTSYWHTQHQIPSMYKCYKHSTMLEKAKYPVVDLKTGVLPHQVKRWCKLIKAETPELDKWQNFVYSVYEKVLGNSLPFIEIKNRITTALGMNNIANYQFMQHIDELTFKLENELPRELLAYLYTDYARASNKGTPKVIGNLYRGINNPYKIRSPIHWILLGYWLFPDELTT